MRELLPHRVVLTTAFVALTCSHAALAQDNVPHPDFTKQPTLYVVGYAHLDTGERFQRNLQSFRTRFAVIHN